MSYNTQKKLQQLTLHGSQIVDNGKIVLHGQKLNGQDARKYQHVSIWSLQRREAKGKGGKA